MTRNRRPAALLAFTVFLVAPAATIAQTQFGVPQLNEEDRLALVASLCKHGQTRQAKWGRTLAQALIMNGWRQMQAGKPNLALESFAEALLGKERPDAYWGMMVSGHLAGYPDELIADCFTRARNSLPDVPGLYSDYGRVLEERGRPREALAHFDKALALNADFIEAHIGAARSYLSLGEEDKARWHGLEAERLQRAQ